MRINNPFKSLDKILADEFKISSRIAIKNYYAVKRYYTKMLNTKFENYAEPDVYYTQADYDEFDGNRKDIALAFTRDFIWFDDRYKNDKKKKV